MKISRLSGLFLVLAACLFAADARGSLTYVLSDHPDGGYAPPLYGLIINNFGGAEFGSLHLAIHQTGLDRPRRLDSGHIGREWQYRHHIRQYVWGPE